MALQPSDLVAKQCTACTSETPALPEAAVRQTIAGMPGWALSTSPRPEIARTFKFANFHETMAFVNAVAWVAHREDHHPDMVVGYNRCVVRYSTHSIGGISENDLICAAKVDALIG
ncbi:MAG TPA: 4a-hydroxytetrahydrobiopterin dehydratase [Tepidisphaeraceae bacterium]|nr:4a-hydroxytetrahydrobiopterin dehydratase [Tepidisphaeraceae bacterium]